MLCRLCKAKVASGSNNLPCLFSIITRMKHTEYLLSLQISIQHEESMLGDAWGIVPKLSWVGLNLKGQGSSLGEQGKDQLYGGGKVCGLEKEGWAVILGSVTLNWGSHLGEALPGLTSCGSVQTTESKISAGPMRHMFICADDLRHF